MAQGPVRACPEAVTASTASLPEPRGFLMHRCSPTDSEAVPLPPDAPLPVSSSVTRAAARDGSALMELERAGMQWLLVLLLRERERENRYREVPPSSTVLDEQSVLAG